jgi:tetratricopeptide (TPR) repeat protein
MKKIALMEYLRRRTVWFAVLSTVVIGYSFLTGLRPIEGDDLFFLLNTARWVVQHHAISWNDVFSYTAQGEPWIYPIGGGLLFYAGWAIGGYGLLSFFGAAGSAATAALLLRKGSIISAVVAVIAVPLISERCQVRADLFTTILTAAFLSLLWHYHDTGKAWLWLLPVLMVIWVNTHLGFFIGLGLIGAYIIAELLELLVSMPTSAAAQRLRRALPWLLASFGATLLNPWGWNIYEGVYRQLSSPQLGWISEWAPVPLNWTMLSMSASLGDIRGAILVSMLIATGTAVIAVLRKQLGAASLLLSAVVAPAGHVRSEALLGIVNVIVGGGVLNAATEALSRKLGVIRVSTVLAIGGTIFGIVLAYTRLDFLSAQGVPLFANGLSSAFPQRAVAFIKREEIPNQILTTNYGAYFTWRLFPKYLDYYDSRTVPFGPQGLARLHDLVSTPSGVEWDSEADRYGISAILASLTQGSMFKLRSFCSSNRWVPVYLDEVSAIFVRRKPENERLIERLEIRCDDFAFSSEQAAMYEESKNGAVVLQALGRYDNALTAARKAIDAAPRSAFAHLLAGELYEAIGRLAEAEQEYRAAIAIMPDGGSEMALAGISHRQGRTEAEIDALRRSADLAWGFRPIKQLLLLSMAELRVGRPVRALAAIDRAIALLAPPPPDMLLRAREAALRAIPKTNHPPTAGGLVGAD